MKPITPQSIMRGNIAIERMPSCSTSVTGKREEAGNYVDFNLPGSPRSWISWNASRYPPTLLGGNCRLADGKAYCSSQIWSDTPFSASSNRQVAAASNCKSFSACSATFTSVASTSRAYNRIAPAAASTRSASQARRSCQSSLPTHISHGSDGESVACLFSCFGLPWFILISWGSVYN